MGSGRRESRARGGHYFLRWDCFAITPTAHATGSVGEPLPMAWLWDLRFRFGGMPAAHAVGIPRRDWEFWFLGHSERGHGVRLAMPGVSGSGSR